MMLTIILVEQRKKNSINFTKAIASCFFLSLHHNGDKSCLCVKKRQLQI